MAAALCFLVTAGCEQQDRRHAEALRIVPGATIGVEDGPESQLLAGVTDARLAESAVLVTELAPPQIREFTRSGEYKRTWSSRGSGPGEVSVPLAVADCGDWIVALDGGTRAFQRFRLGQFVDQVRSPVPLNSHTNVAGCNGPLMVITILKERMMVPGRNEQPRALVLVDHRTGNIEAELDLGSRPLFVTPGSRYAPIPLIPERHVTVVADSILVVDGGTAAVEVRELPDLRLHRRFTIQGLSQPDDDVQEARKLAGERWADALPYRNAVTTSKRILETMPTYEDPLPLLDQLFSDSRGRLWIRTMDSYGGNEAIWAITDLDGTIQRKVAMERTVEIKDIDEDILGLDRDELGVERLQLIPIGTLLQMDR